MNLAQLLTAFQSTGLVRKESLSPIGNALDLIKAAVEGAVAEFSKYVPRVEKLDFEWTGTAESLASWYEDSRVIAVESPRGEVPPTLLPTSRYYVDPYDKTIALIDVETGTLARARYGALHSVSGTGNITIPPSRLQAYYYLVAAKLCEAIAARHAEENKGNVSDVTDHSSKAREFLALAKEYRKQFLAAANASETTGARPAEAVAEYATPWRGVLR